MSDTKQTIRRQIIGFVSGVQTGTVSHSQATDGILGLFDEYAQQRETSARISELENLPPYMFDAYPSLTDRLKTLKEGE